MHDDAMVAGRVTQFSEPGWEPLVEAVGDTLAGGFMWMFEVELDDGLRVHAYKHRWTRQYLHLGEDGSHWVFVDADVEEVDWQVRRSTYRRFPLSAALELVLGDWIDGLTSTDVTPAERDAFDQAIAWAIAAEDADGGPCERAA